jgi:hypothetical protein
MLVPGYDDTVLNFSPEVKDPKRSIVGFSRCFLSNVRITFRFNPKSSFPTFCNTQYSLATLTATLSTSLFLMCATDGSIKGSDISCRSSTEGDHYLAMPLPSKLAEDPLPHHYCFSKGRHSGSFYLKVGAAGECSLRHSSHHPVNTYLATHKFQ